MQTPPARCMNNDHHIISNFVFQGVTIFNSEEKTLVTIAEKMVGEMVSKKAIRSGDREGVLNSLLQNRR